MYKSPLLWLGYGTMSVMHELVIVFAKYVVGIPVLVLALVFFKLTKRRRLELAVFLAASVVITVLLAKIAASAHQDPRPFVRDGVKPYFAHGRDNGFPSDHTTYSAVIAFVIMRYYRWLGITLAVVSLAIGSARVIAGIHHGQDIIAGFLIAAVGVVAGFVITKMIKSQYLERKRASVSK